MYLLKQTRNSIAIRYIVIIGTVLISAQLLYGLFVALSNYSLQQRDLHQKAVSRASFLSAVSPDNLLANNFYPLETIIRETDADADVVYSVIVDNEDRALTTYLNGTDPHVRNAVENASGHDTLSRVDFIANHPNIIEVESQILAEGLLIGKVRLGYTRENLEARFQQTITLLLFTSVVFGLFLASGTIILFRFQISKPLSQLTEFAAILASGKLDERAIVKSENEIGQLQSAMNTMATQLQDSLDELQMLSHVASRTNNLVVIGNPDGKIEWVNEAFVEVTGYTLDEAKGKSPGSLLQGPESDPSTIEYMREQLKAGNGFYAEIINYSKSGEKYLVGIEVQPVFDDHGVLTTFIAIETDITQRKEAEATLQQYAKDMAQANLELYNQQTQLRSLLEIATQTENVEEQLMHVVKNGTTNLGMSVGLVSRINHDVFTISEVYSDDYDLGKGMSCSLQETLCAKTIQQNYILAFEDFDGTEIKNARAFDMIDVKSYIGVPLTVNGEVVGTLSFLSDKPREEPFKGSEYDYIQMMSEWVNVTLERQSARKELEDYAEELERSNRELQDFAYVASHDLQEPLRKIQAFGSRIESKYADVLDERGVDYLQRMQNAASRMQTLINDLLSFSRVATQAKPFKSVNLKKVLAGVLSDLEIRIEQSQGRVDAADLMTIDADDLQIRQIFQNIIGNALKFAHPDRAPIINITSTDIEIDSVNFCEIRITDNGVGFDQKYSDKIFGIFQRLHGKHEYEGTGVGLAICRRIVERHKGFIRAESKPGVGTTFIVQLPIEQENKSYD